MLAAFCLPLSAFAIVGLFMRQHTDTPGNRLTGRPATTWSGALRASKSAWKTPPPPQAGIPQGLRRPSSRGPLILSGEEPKC